jgi:hypothetical protein
VVAAGNKVLLYEVIGGEPDVKRFSAKPFVSCGPSRQQGELILQEVRHPGLPVQNMHPDLYMSLLQHT